MTALSFWGGAGAGASVPPPQAAASAARIRARAPQATFRACISSRPISCVLGSSDLVLSSPAITTLRLSSVCAAAAKGRVRFRQLDRLRRGAHPRRQHLLQRRPLGRADGRVPAPPPAPATLRSPRGPGRPRDPLGQPL